MVAGRAAQRHRHGFGYTLSFHSKNVKSALELEHSDLKIRNAFLSAALCITAAAIIFLVTGCLGKESIFAGRPVPPSTMRQRVLVSIQNPSPIQSGALQIVNARYDIRHSEDGHTPFYPIKGYQGKLPTTIINFPEQSVGYVYGSGDGSLATISYGKEQEMGVVSGLAGFSSDVFVTADGGYIYAASQAAQYISVIDSVKSIGVRLNLPNVYKVVVNPSGTVVLAFVQNSNYAYRVIRLQQPNGTVMQVPTFPNEATWPADVSPVSCQPVNLPIYCVVPVLGQDGNPVVFDRPFNTIFSSDGTTGWLLNCGPECGDSNVDPVTGQATASVSFLNLGPLNIYNFPGSTYPAPPQIPPLPTEQRRVAVPGGATMALYGKGMLYISGQQRQPDGLFGGVLSVMNLSTNQVTASYPISDGTHTKMLFGDDNTLWIGAQLCASGERTAKNLINPTTGNIDNGCLTFFNMADNSVFIEPNYGDVTGLCAIIQWHKIYTAYGGQIHIFATTDKGITTNQGRAPRGYKAGDEIDNFEVTVQGTAYDVAYMDAPANAEN